MCDYEGIKRGKLVLKGEKLKSKKKKKRKRSETEVQDQPGDLDTAHHGGWSKALSTREMTGPVAIEIGEGTYVAALDNGLFTLGPPHSQGEGPSPEEILTGIRVSETRVAFKSGYDKYLGVTKEGTVTGRADAIGPLEQWEPVYQDDRMALLSNMGCFMSVERDDDRVVALRRTAGEEEMVWVRSQARGLMMQEGGASSTGADEDQGSLKDVELSYVKKFQKFQDKKIKMSKEDRGQLRQAKETGKLHESMLDRRSKMKADRYCK